MATYTQANVDDVRAAILALATGKRVVSVTFAGRTTTYQPQDIDKLNNLLAIMVADVAEANGTRQNYRLASTSKFE